MKSQVLSTTALTLLLLLGGLPVQAENPGPTSPQTAQVSKTEAAPEAADEKLLDTIRQLRWNADTWAASSPVYRLGFADVVRQTEAQDFEFRLSREKVNETAAKREDVESKRILFFFKYFDSAFLEGSAESDVMAAAAHAQVVLNESLMDSLSRYYTLMRAMMGQYVAFSSIEQGKTQLLLNEKRFNSGDSTIFDVMQTKVELVKRYQDYLMAGVTCKIASMALAEQLNRNMAQVLYPGDLSFSEEEFNIPLLGFFSDSEANPDKFDANGVVQIALENRPELKELKFRRISLDNLYKASTIKFDKVQEKILTSSLKQLDLRREKAERAIEAMTRKAFEEYRFAREKITLALQQKSIAAKALKQTRVSNQAGFSSNKDVLDAQVAYSKAQVNYADALIDYNSSQLKLLYEMGLISTENLLAGHVKL